MLFPDKVSKMNEYRSGKEKKSVQIISKITSNSFILNKVFTRLETLDFSSSFYNMTRQCVTKFMKPRRNHNSMDLRS